MCTLPSSRRKSAGRSFEIAGGGRSPAARRASSSGVAVGPERKPIIAELAPSPWTLLRTIGVLLVTVPAIPEASILPISRKAPPLSSKSSRSRSCCSCFCCVASRPPARILAWIARYSASCAATVSRWASSSMRRFSSASSVFTASASPVRLCSAFLRRSIDASSARRRVALLSPTPIAKSSICACATRWPLLVAKPTASSLEKLISIALVRLAMSGLKRLSGSRP